MNHLYRLVWNDSLRARVPAAECTRARGKTCSTGPHGAAPARPPRPLRRLSLWLALAFAPAAALALPQGEQLAGGTAGVSRPDAATLTIRQSTPRAILNWQSFDIAAGEKVSVVQPSADAVLLNRVLGNEYSLIEGSLRANGRVFLVNPSGIVFGESAQVNVGGLVASSLGIRNEDFMAGSYRFQGDTSPGEVLNSGHIAAAEGGAVALLGARVGNDGTIEARLGTVMLAGGSDLTLDFAGNGLLKIKVDAGAVDALAYNGGLLRADGGVVLMTASAADRLAQAVVNNQGVIEARSVDERGGEIGLLATGEQSRTEVGGTLDATTGDEATALIVTQGGTLALQPGVVVDAGVAGLWQLEADHLEVGETEAEAISASLNAANHVNLIARGNARPGTLKVRHALQWENDARLRLAASGDIELGATLQAPDGVLELDTPGTIAASASLQLGRFVLENGTWHQLAAQLPAFSARDFRIESSGRFLRALDGDGSSTRPYRLSDIYGVQGIGSHGMLGAHYQLAGDIDASGTAGWWDGAGFRPIGLQVDPLSDLPFFGSLDGQGHTLRGLKIERPDQTGVGLFGVLFKATLSGVHLAEASVRGDKRVGGLAGESEGSRVSDSSFEGSVSGASELGGLVGRAHDQATVSGSRASGSVSGDEYLGGLVGSNLSGSSVSDSRADVDVSGKNYLGGLVGLNAQGSSVSDSEAHGNVSGEQFVGGLAGVNDGEPSLITGSRAFGAVSGSDVVGGLAGLNAAGAAIEDSQASGRVSGGMRTGGLVGVSQQDSSIRGSSAAGDVSGTTLVGGLVGRNSASSIADSEASGAVSGTDDLGGLVGVNTSEARIERSHAGGQVTGSGNWVGGLVGSNLRSSAISDSYATGAVSGHETVGGLVGVNQSQSVIARSFASGAVSGVAETGGLVGSQYEKASVEDSYASGAVSGERRVGGLMGTNELGGTIARSHANGAVSGTSETGGLLGHQDEASSVSSSYWDRERSGQSASAAGLGLSTAQMQDARSFEGWSLATTGGSSAVWRLYEGRSAPLLRGFLQPLTVTLSDVRKTYDGTAYQGDGGMGFSLSVDERLLLGRDLHAGNAQGARNAGRYTLDTGLHSGQLGYDISVKTGTLSINPASLEVGIADLRASQGQALPAWSAWVQGLAAGEALQDVVRGRLQLQAVPDMTAAPGDYALVPTGYTLRSGNYVIVYRPGVLHLQPHVASAQPDGYRAAMHGVQRVRCHPDRADANALATGCDTRTAAVPSERLAVREAGAADWLEIRHGGLRLPAELEPAQP